MKTIRCNCKLKCKSSKRKRNIDAPKHICQSCGKEIKRKGYCKDCRGDY